MRVVALRPKLRGLKLQDGEWGIGNGEWEKAVISYPHSLLPIPHFPFSLRFRGSDNAAGHASSGIPRRLGLQVIGVSVNYHAVTDDRAVAV